MVVKIKRLNDTAALPEKGTKYSAGHDLRANINETLRIAPHTTVKIPTGLAAEIPNGYFGGIYPRSGISTKRGLRLANCVGVIDSDYRGELIVPIHNDTDTTQVIEANERIAQLIVLPYAQVDFEEDTLSDTSRGVGGFGSTGTN